MAKSIVWFGTLGTEGGPIVLGDAQAFDAWAGTFADEQERWRVHYYGPLVAKLPAKLLPQGPAEWHQHVELSSEAEARARAAALVEAVKRLAPEAKPRTQRAKDVSELLELAASATTPKGMDAWLEAWRDTIEQGVDYLDGNDRIFHIECASTDDYTRACDRLDDDDIVLFEYRPGLAVVVWEMEGGTVLHLAARSDGKELILADVSLSGDGDDAEERAAAHAAVEKPRKNEKKKAIVEIASGVGVAAWGPVSADELAETTFGARPLSAALAHALMETPSAELDGSIDGVGSAFCLVPGRYQISCGEVEADWSCRFCRLTWIGAPEKPIAEARSSYAYVETTFADDDEGEDDEDEDEDEDEGDGDEDQNDTDDEGADVSFATWDEVPNRKEIASLGALEGGVATILCDVNVAAKWQGEERDDMGEIVSDLVESDRFAHDVGLLSITDEETAWVIQVQDALHLFAVGESLVLVAPTNDDDHEEARYARLATVPPPESSYELPTIALPSRALALAGAFVDVAAQRETLVAAHERVIDTMQASRVGDEVLVVGFASDKARLRKATARVGTTRFDLLYIVPG